MGDGCCGGAGGARRSPHVLAATNSCHVESAHLTICTHFLVPPLYFRDTFPSSAWRRSASKAPPQLLTHTERVEASPVQGRTRCAACSSRCIKLLRHRFTSCQALQRSGARCPLHLLRRTRACEWETRLAAQRVLHPSSQFEMKGSKASQPLEAPGRMPVDALRPLSRVPFSPLLQAALAVQTAAWRL
jgi:hypothetical protein